MARKYPQKGPEELLGDLVASTPGQATSKVEVAPAAAASRGAE